MQGRWVTRQCTCTQRGILFQPWLKWCQLRASWRVESLNFLRANTQESGTHNRPDIKVTLIQEISDGPKVETMRMNTISLHTSGHPCLVVKCFSSSVSSNWVNISTTFWFSDFIHILFHNYLYLLLIIEIW